MQIICVHYLQGDGLVWLGAPAPLPSLAVAAFDFHPVWGYTGALLTVEEGAEAGK
jgi:hypothetical protein